MVEQSHCVRTAHLGTLLVRWEQPQQRQGGCGRAGLQVAHQRQLAAERRRRTTFSTSSLFARRFLIPWVFSKRASLFVFLCCTMVSTPFVGVGQKRKQDTATRQKGRRLGTEYIAASCFSAVLLLSRTFTPPVVRFVFPPSLLIMLRHRPGRPATHPFPPRLWRIFGYPQTPGTGRPEGEVAVTSRVRDQ